MRRKFLICLLSGITVTLIFLGSYTNCSAQGEKNMRQKVEEIFTRYRTIGDPEVPELLAELGSPVVPVLLELLEEDPTDVGLIEALGMIGDERATPLLLEILEASLNKDDATVAFVMEALERIGDTRTENIMLRIFEDKNQEGGIRLLAGKILLKVGSENSREKVKQFVATTHHLQKRAWFWLDAEAVKELRKFGVDYASGEAVGATAELIVGLKDVELLTSSIRFGGWRKAECKALAEIGTPEAIEVLYKAAENDESMWAPNIPPEATESEREESQQVNPYTRIAAVESLLIVSGVDINRVTRAFEDIPVAGLRVIPLTVKLQPDKWNFQWKKVKGKEDNDNDDEGEGKINCYLGNILGGYSAWDIVPESILLNGEVSPSKKGRKGKIHAKVKRRRKGFIGKVLEVKFNKFEAIKSIESIWPGKECNITITGRLKDDMPFKGSYRIEISKPEEDDDEGEED